MTDLANIPEWVAILVGALALIGGALTLLGCIGLARGSTFYDRVHFPTLGSSFGVFFTLTASVVYFSVSGQRLAVHEVLILVLVAVTTPVTLMLLARAALYRDRTEKNPDVPPSPGQDMVTASIANGTDPHSES
jgi:multicomponent K+:H+ antiporter subunit G